MVNHTAANVAPQLIYGNTPGVPGNAEADDEFGAALAVGDFNDDGFDDLAIGAPGEAIGTRQDAGAVFITYGSGTGLDAATTQLVYGSTPGTPGIAEANDRFGQVLAAGDLTGDGIDELAIGIPHEDLGSQVSAGAVLVLTGASGGLQTAGSTLLTGSTPGLPGLGETGDEFGAALLIGNYDNGVGNELIIGVPGESLGTTRNSGAVIIVDSDRSGPHADGSTMIHGQTPGLPGWGETNDRFGSALALNSSGTSGRNSLVIGIPGEAVGDVENAGAIIELAPVFTGGA